MGKDTHFPPDQGCKVYLEETTLQNTDAFTPLANNKQRTNSDSTVNGRDWLHQNLLGGFWLLFLFCLKAEILIQKV